MRASTASFVILLHAVLATAASAQQSEEDKAYIRLSRIKQVTLISSSYLEGRVFMEIKFTKQYDRHGNLTIETGYDSDDGLPAFSTMTLYRYDEQNRIREYTTGGGTRLVSHTLDTRAQVIETIVRNKKDGTLFERYVFVRDADGSLREQVVYRDGVVHRRRTYGRDPQGNLIEFREMKGDGAIVTRRTHAYNSHGNATESLEYGADGRLIRKTVFTYQGDHLMERRMFDGSGALTSRHALKRDANGFPIEETEYDGAGVVKEVTRTTYEFYPPIERRLTS